LNHVVEVLVDQRSSVIFGKSFNIGGEDRDKRLGNFHLSLSPNLLYYKQQLPAGSRLKKSISWQGPSSSDCPLGAVKNVDKTTVDRWDERFRALGDHNGRCSEVYVGSTWAREKTPKPPFVERNATITSKISQSKKFQRPNSP